MDYNPTWLCLDFIRKILENDSSITDKTNILSYKCERAVKNGENYSSELFRIRLDLNIENSIQNKSYIVKQSLDANTDSGKNLILLNVFKKELTMYSETLVDIGEVLKSVECFTSIGPRLLYWCKEPVELLVLEDLAAQGFSPPNREQGLNRKQCELALKKLAHLHAASIFLNKKDSKYRNIYDKGGFFENMPDYLSQYYLNGVKQSIEVMKKLPDCKKYVKGFETYCDSMVERGIKLLQPICADVEDYNVLCHGDFWLNNIMFKYDKQGEPVDVIFVDFQMSTFGNPGLDLNYFFFTSPTEDTRRRFREVLLKQYIEVVGDILTKLQYAGLIPVDGDLNRKLFEAKDIAIITPGIVLPIVKLSQEHSKTITTEALMKSNESGTGVGLYSNPAYIAALNDAVQYLAEIGFITEKHV